LKHCGRATAKARQPDASRDEATLTDASHEAAALTDASQDAASLTEAIKAIATGYARIERAKPPDLADTSFTEVMQDVASRVRKPPATRQGRKGIVIYVDPEVAAAIHRLAAGLNNATVQDLGVQAFEYLFEKFGEPWPV